MPRALTWDLGIPTDDASSTFNPRSGLPVDEPNPVFRTL
jgi:hypothetical protein